MPPLSPDVLLNYRNRDFQDDELDKRRRLADLLQIFTDSLEMVNESRWADPVITKPVPSDPSCFWLLTREPYGDNNGFWYRLYLRGVTGLPDELLANANPERVILGTGAEDYDLDTKIRYAFDLTETLYVVLSTD